jgi:hypothetical protein
MSAYITKRDDILVHAGNIAQQYQAQGLILTVRQMYYQFVARGLLPSGQNQYKKIVSTLSNARYDGRFDLDLIEDRTRTVHGGSFTRNDHSVARALLQAADWVQNMPSFFLARDRWYGQSTHVSVWVEKEALAGIFEPTCRELGVSWLACKGCPSVSALWDWIKSSHQAQLWGESGYQRYNYPNMPTVTEKHSGLAERSVILYFGDHDPTGFMIPRAAQDGIDKLMEVSGKRLNLHVKRIALNMDQIEQYDPPPFWAKTTDTRYQTYVDEHDTTEAWELDALDPTVLRNLIRTEVDEYFDHDIHKELQEESKEARRNMLDLMRNPEWIEEALNIGGEE